MPFIPLDQPRKATDPRFPRVSYDEQAARDADAEQLIAGEFAQDMDADSRAALGREYRQRFGKEAPTVAAAPERRRGFTPISEDAPPVRRGFTPLAPEEPEKPSVLKTLALNNPLTAAGEVVLNFGSQGLGMPAAGLAGLATAAGNALGLTDKNAADVVHSVGDALTYRPRGEMGAKAAEAVAWPFEKLHEGATWAGDRVLDATGSPVAATAVATAIEGVLPMAVAPVAKGARRAMAKPAEAVPRIEPTLQERPQGFTPLETERIIDAEAARPEAISETQKAQVDTRQSGAKPGGEIIHEGYQPEAKGFTPINAAENGQGAQRLAGNEPAMLRTDVQELRQVRRGGDSGLPGMADELSQVPGRHGAGAEPNTLAGAAGRDGPLLARELRVDDAAGARTPENVLPEGDLRRATDDGRRSGEIARPADPEQRSSSLESRAADRSTANGEAVPKLDVADLQGRDATASRMVTPDGDQLPHAAAAGEIGLADSIDSGSDTAAGPKPKTARWALVEADRLKPSHDANMRPIEDHPFGRKEVPRHENEKAVQGIVGEFDAKRLAEALDDADGAPIVARDGIVENGQRRAISLMRIYQANGLKADTYRAFLRETAPRLGLDPAAVDQMKKPVLVRVPDEAAPRHVESAMPADGTVNSFAPGARYTGFIDDSPMPGKGPAGVTSDSLPTQTSKRAEPIRREDILIQFAKDMGASIYEGRVRGENRLGFFRPKNEEVRIKRHADLEVAAHEMAHLMDKRIPEIRKAWENDKALAAELKAISYDAGKVYEGFAEGVRLWMTQPDVLEAKAPRFAKWFDDFAQRHEYGPAILKAREGMTEWFGQDAIDRARSKIGDHRPLSDALNVGRDQFRQAVIDDLHGVYRMERELQGGKIAPAGAYETARLARASHSIADGALRFGYPVKKADGSFSWKGKGLEEILKPVAGSLDDALLYFVGKSARELLAQGREHLFTPGEIDGMLKLRTPEREAAFKAYQEWNQGILDFAEAQGVINPESRRLWQRTQYLPFRRVGQPGGFKGKPGDWSGLKALTGGTENIRDILANMTGNAAQLLDKALKNEARLKIAELAENAEGGGKFMVKIPTESRPVRIDTKQVVDALMKGMGVDASAKMSPATAKAIKALRSELEAAPALLEVMQPGMPPAGGNVVAVLKGGKPTWYEVADPILFRALSSIDRPLQTAVVKWLGLPKRVGQMSITLTPEFAVANIARDTILGSVMSRAGFRPVIDSLNGMRLRLTNDPLYQEFIANGGGMSSMFLDETRFRAKLEKFYQRQGIDYRTVLDAPAKLGNFIETLADSFEMSTRLGEFQRAIQRGEHPRHAAYLGREVSTDFAMRGDSKTMGFMYDTVMFMKPAVLSWDRLARGLAHDSNKMAIAAKTGTLAMMSMALYLLNKDDQRYQDLPDWDRDSNWHFFVGDQHFRYPKIWEIGAVASTAERTTEKLLAEDPQGLGKDFARILGATFNINWMPQIVAPLYEQATNRSNFTKAPIETPGMENLQPFLRAKPTTNETLKAAGMATRNLPEALQVNPARAEALLRGYFNTWAMYGLMLSDQAFFGDKLPAMRADQMPVIRRFYSQEPPQRTKFETEFYDLLGEAKRLHGTMRELDRLGRPDLADEKEADPMATEAKPLERAAKNLSGINKDMLAVRRSDATPAEKRQQLDALMVERNALVKAAVLDSKNARKEKQ